MISSGNSACICRGALSNFSFHRIFKLPTLSGRRIVSSRCQLVRWGLPPSVGQSAPDSTAQQTPIAHKAVRVRIAAYVISTEGVGQIRVSKIVKWTSVVVLFEVRVNKLPSWDTSGCECKPGRAQ